MPVYDPIIVEAHRSDSVDGLIALGQSGLGFTKAQVDAAGFRDLDSLLFPLDLDSDVVPSYLTASTGLTPVDMSGGPMPWDGPPVYYPSAAAAPTPSLSPATTAESTPIGSPAPVTAAATSQAQSCPFQHAQPAHHPSYDLLLAHQALLQQAVNLNGLLLYPQAGPYAYPHLQPPSLPPMPSRNDGHGTNFDPRNGPASPFSCSANSSCSDSEHDGGGGHSYDPLSPRSSFSGPSGISHHDILNGGTISSSASSSSTTGTNNTKKTKSSASSADLVKRYPCSYAGCHRVFARRYNLSTHIASTHLQSKPFSCPCCQKSFSRRHDLGRHLAAVHDASLATMVPKVPKSVGG